MVIITATAVSNIPLKGADRGEDAKLSGKIVCSAGCRLLGEQPFIALSSEPAALANNKQSLYGFEIRIAIRAGPARRKAVLIFER